jgi:DNA polymerase epsilon subunit 1
MARDRGRGFGLTSSRGRGRVSFRSGGYRGGSYRGGRGRGRDSGSGQNGGNAPKRDDEGTQLAERFEQVKLNDEVDEKLGFARVQEGNRREGWLVNMHPVRALILLQLST